MTTWYSDVCANENGQITLGIFGGRANMILSPWILPMLVVGWLMHPEYCPICPGNEFPLILFVTNLAFLVVVFFTNEDERW